MFIELPEYASLSGQAGETKHGRGNGANGIGEVKSTPPTHLLSRYISRDLKKGRKIISVVA
jgi:hypothetical protein